MTWLEDVLAGRRPPGFFYWSSHAEAKDVREQVERSGWRFVHLDTSSVRDKRGFLDEAARAFGFPEHFGRNWDALADSLSDVRSSRGTLVLWEGWRPFSETDDGEFAVAVEVLLERTQSHVGGAFVVLARRDEDEPSS